MIRRLPYVLGVFLSQTGTHMSIETTETWSVGNDASDVSSGYVKLFRSALSHRYFSNPQLWHFYQYCILKATFQDHTVMVGFQSIELLPGQFIFGRKMASIETGLSEQVIRTCLKKLEKDEKLTIKSTNKFSIISVVNYGIWQRNTNDTNQQSNQQLTNNQPTTNHKQEYKERKERNIYRSLIEKPENVDQQIWDDFCKIRQTKKAPVTQTAINGITKQAGIAGYTLNEALAICCERNWQGFKADWVDKKITIHTEQRSAFDSQEKMDALIRQVEEAGKW